MTQPPSDAPRGAAACAVTPLSADEVSAKIAKLEAWLEPHRKWGECPMTGVEDCCDTLVQELALLRRVAVTLETLTTERDRLADILRVLDEHKDLWYHIRPGRNYIGVSTGGWLVCQAMDGPERHATNLAEAVDLACSALGIPRAARAPGGE